jgi:hypothetical protein
MFAYLYKSDFKISAHLFSKVCKHSHTAAVSMAVLTSAAIAALLAEQICILLPYIFRQEQICALRDASLTMRTVSFIKPATAPTLFLSQTLSVSIYIFSPLG